MQENPLFCRLRIWLMSASRNPSASDFPDPDVSLIKIQHKAVHIYKIIIALAREFSCGR